jgi:hypothetical protein
MKNKKNLCSVCFLFAFMSVLWGQNIVVEGNVAFEMDEQPIIGMPVVELISTNKVDSFVTYKLKK